ncbi:CIA30 family protein, partial [Flavobacteriales bacterium]|nr:CIA30 family protein [Flavobacteriales bacterium]
MKYLIYMILLSSSIASNVIFDFNKSSDIENWIIIDDAVMGGKSSGSFKLNSEGHGLFEGVISLENNGGFSSV